MDQQGPLSLLVGGGRLALLRSSQSLLSSPFIRGLCLSSNEHLSAPSPAYKESLTWEMRLLIGDRIPELKEM